MKQRVLSVAAVLAVAGAIAAAQPFQYPAARKSAQVDDYFGTKVADPYRWMEDDNSAETAAWVKAENAITFPYLERIPFRDAMQKRVKQLNDYPKYSSPSHK